MSEFLSLITPMRRINLLLGLIAVLVILLVLSSIGTSAPKIATTFGGSTVNLRADRAWVFVPEKCVTVSWNVEGIQSLYINGGGKIGWGEESFCPSLEATSPVFEFTAANGEIRDFRLGIHYLPADVIHSLALMALLAPFVVAIYYVAIPRLEQPIPLNMSSVLLLLALLLLFLLIQTVRTFSIESVLSGLGDVFARPAWQVFGLVLAGLVFIPLAIQETWTGVKRRAWADFIVVAALMIFVLLLFLPFGFGSIGHWEEWVYRAYLEGRPSRVSTESVSRFWHLLVYPAAHVISPDSFVGLHLIQMVLFSSGLALLYGITRSLNLFPLLAFLLTTIAFVYPVNADLLSTRSIPHTLNICTLLTAIYLMQIFKTTPSRLKQLGILLALFFNIGSYEAGYAIILVVPILWLLRSPMLTWRNFNLTTIWYLTP